MTPEEMAAHKARLEVLDLMGYGHSSKAGPEYIAKLYTKLRDERDALLLQIDVQKAEAEKWRSAAESFGKRADVAERLIDVYRKALERLKSPEGMLAIGVIPDDQWGDELKARMRYAEASLIMTETEKAVWSCPKDRGQLRLQITDTAQG